MLENRLKYLMGRQHDGSLTDTEQLELEAWDQVLERQDGVLEMYSEEEQQALKEQLWERIQKATSEEAEIIEMAPAVHRVHILRTAWFRYAAAVLIIFGIGAYFWNTQQKEKPSVTQTSPVPVQNDVAPGGNRATLTLADGSKIILDSAKSGELAKEENATITKTEDGRIVYDPNEILGDRYLINTMSTPRGGQYQLTLPDGSQIWLNAESSITYPTAFSGSERRVAITGEVYFEIAKSKTKKFIVSVEGRQEVEVLGTHFNINAYKEEPTINTTLLEGSVRLTSHVSRLPNNDQEKKQTSVHTSLILKPGQQGQLSANKLSLAVNPDIEQVMAWKNGMFLMSNTDLATIMRQVTRWYDIDVVYETKPSNERFFGGISRNLPLSGILDLLKNAGVSFRLDGRTLYVRP